LRLHVLDVYVDEVERSLDSGKEKGKEFSDKKKTVVKKLLEPVERLEKETQSKLVRKRARDTLGDSRVKVWLGIKEEAAAEEEEEEEWQGIQDD
jgi:ribosomal RNA-processing protein 1